MLDASRNDVHLAGFHGDVAILEFDCQDALMDEEQLVRVVVLVPDEFVPHLDRLEIYRRFNNLAEV